MGWLELPWHWMLPWAAAVGAGVAGWQWLRRQRAERERAEELLRLGQVARLNTLGELAAGMAHELNQPLAAVLASTQAARRLLDDEPPELDTARGAMRQAEQQARRAADVVARLRRGVERPTASASLQPVVLQDAVRNAFYLLEPEFAKRQVARNWTPAAGAGGAGRAGGAGADHPQPAHQRLAGARPGAAGRTQLSVTLEADQARARSRWATPGPASRPSCCRASSNPSSPRASTAWAWA